MIRRRALAVLLGGSALAACTVPTTAAAWATDASALATGLGKLLPQLTAVVSIPTAAATAAATALSAAASLASQLANTAAATVGASLLAQIESYVNTAFAALQPYFSLLPSPVGTALTAVSLLLPFIETALGMITAPTARAVLMKVPAPTQAPAGMTPTQTHKWAVSVLTS